MVPHFHVQIHADDGFWILGLCGACAMDFTEKVIDRKNVRQSSLCVGPTYFTEKVDDALCNHVVHSALYDCAINSCIRLLFFAAGMCHIG